MKTCRMCGAKKSEACFYSDKRAKDGLVSICDACTSVRNRGYREKTKEARAAYDKEYAAANPERMRANRENHRRRRSQTPKWKIDHAVSVGIRKGIKTGSKRGRKWFDLVGYTINDLMAHLEGQFKLGMSWENYGALGWHIDHIKPKSLFKYNAPDDVAFKECWALSNLQPLWGYMNSSKGAKWPIPANDNNPSEADHASSQ